MNANSNEAQPLDEGRRPAHPDVTVYVTKEPDGRLVPVVCSVGGISFPIVHGSINMDPNGTETGTRAMTATITFSIGGGAIVEVGGPEDVPELDSFVES